VHGAHEGGSPLFHIIIGVKQMFIGVGIEVFDRVPEFIWEKQIVGIDGSTDSTSEVLIPYNGQVTYVYQERAGVAAARNRGLEAADGDLIAFLENILAGSLGIGTEPGLVLQSI